MANTRGDLNVDIGARLDKFERALRDVQGEFKKLSGNIQSRSKTASNSMENAFVGKLKNIASSIAAAFSVQQIAKFATEAVNLAAKAEGIESAFNRLNKPNLLGNLRSATRGTVTDLELMRQAVRANNFQVPLEKLASFFEFATQRSAQTGESVDYLVNSIIDGIGRKSTLVLDNLGISAARLQDEVKKTGDFGAAAGKIIQEELGKAGNVATTAAQKIAAQRVELENTQKEIGDKLVPAYLTINGLILDFIKGGDMAGTTVNIMTRAIVNQKTETQKLNERWADFMAKISKYSKQEGPKQKQTLEEITAAMNAQADAAYKAFQRSMFFRQSKRLDMPEVEIAKEIGSLGRPGAQQQVNKIQENLIAQQNRLNAQLAQGFEIAATFGGALNSAFMDGIENGLNFGDALKKMFEDLAKQMAAALVTAVALKAVLSALGLGSAVSIGSLFTRQLGLGNAINAGQAGGLNISGFNRIAGTQLVTTYKLGSQDASRWNNTAG